MCKMTKVELELIVDGDMYMFFEKVVGSGVSYIFQRYTKDKNKNLKSYDPKEESKRITYLDTNNFYGYAMSKFLPTSGSKWIDPKDFDSNNYSNNSSKDCVLEVDLEYPKELSDLHNDYALAPEKLELKKEMLSNYELKIADFYNIPIGNIKKLVTNVFDKDNYVLHYQNLQLYLRTIKLKKYTVY